MQMAVHESTAQLAADNEQLRLALAGARDASARTGEEAARTRSAWDCCVLVCVFVCWGEALTCSLQPGGARGWCQERFGARVP